jgi:hypothetical protein
MICANIITYFEQLETNKIGTKLMCNLVLVISKCILPFTLDILEAYNVIPSNIWHQNNMSIKTLVTKKD